MEEISEEEANKLLEDGEKALRKIIDDGGKIEKTTIEEKDKITEIVKIEPINGEPISSTVITTKNEISLQTNKNHLHS